MTRRDEMAPFAGLRNGDLMRPARPGLIRTVIGGGLLCFAVSWGALWVVMAMGGA